LPMELVQIQSTDEIADEELRKRHAKHANFTITRHFLARRDGQDAGYLAVDINPHDEKYFVVYELFVPKRLRNQGIATWMLEMAEKMGAGLGYPEALIHPKTLDDQFSQEDLEAWYHRRGYASLPNQEDTFVKLLR
jgi:GNAT superfamily N-acetyltransferase